MLKLLILLILLTSCSQHDSLQNENESITQSEISSDFIQSEEKTEEAWSKKLAEDNKDIPIENLLSSQNSAPYYIQGEIQEDINIISDEKKDLFLKNSHSFKRGDIVKLWGNIKNEKVEEKGKNIYKFEIIESELAEEFTGSFLSPGSYIIGENIDEGRYEIVGSNLGNIRIYDEYNEVCDEAIGGDGINGVRKLFVNLIAGYKLDITDVETTKFTPNINRKSLNTLYTGFWEVGTDIDAGEYKIKSVTNQAGKIFILSSYGDIKLDHGLGETSEDPEPTILLEDGDIIWIQKMDSVKFESINTANAN